MHLAAERCNHLMPHYLAHFNGAKSGRVLGANFPKRMTIFPGIFPVGRESRKLGKLGHIAPKGAGPVSLASQRRRINEKSFHFNSFSLKNTPYTFHVHKSSGIVYYIILYIGSTWETWEAGNKLNFLSAGEKGKR